MNGAGDIVGQFVKRSEKAKKLRETRSDSDGEDGIPDEKSSDGLFGDGTFFPSDSGVCKVSDDSSNSGGNKIRKPDEIVVFDDEIGEDSE